MKKQKKIEKKHVIPRYGVDKGKFHQLLDKASQPIKKSESDSEQP